MPKVATKSTKTRAGAYRCTTCCDRQFKDFHDLDRHNKKGIKYVLSILQQDDAKTCALRYWYLLGHIGANMMAVSPATSRRTLSETIFPAYSKIKQFPSQCLESYLILNLLLSTKEKTRPCPFCPRMFFACYEVTLHFQKQHPKLLWHCNVEKCTHEG